VTMTSINSYPLSVPAISVTQPLGTFFVASIPARVLLDTAYSDKLRAVKAADGKSYELEGSQRELIIPRLKEIGDYIKSDESTFPNSIILAPNFSMESGEPIEDDEIGKSLRWNINEIEDPNLPSGRAYFLTIPSPEAIAPIIDGQHRLFGFKYCGNPKRLDTELVCSIFLDLPKPYQAFLFATINSNQKSVSKSQTYELFGYNVEKEPPEFWSPDKLAVYFARKLNGKDENQQDESPLTERIIVSAANDFSQSRSEGARDGKWMVSMATVVEGIARLFSQNQKRDRIALLQLPKDSRYRSELKRVAPGDKSPLRELFINSNDLLIYTALKNYLLVVNDLFWSKNTMDSYICKTVGVQALFDVLLVLAKEGFETKKFSIYFFHSKLSGASAINFQHERFKNASGSGRLLIKNCIFRASGIEKEKMEDLDAKKLQEIDEAITGKPLPT